MDMERPKAGFPASLGLVELSSIARGIETIDRMLKAAEVELVLARTICSGKYIVLIAGDLHMVEASVEAGRAVAAECMIDSFLIQNVHPDVFPALSSTVVPGTHAALGILSLEEASLDEEIEGLIAERTAARKNKDWARSDEIRDELQARGILLEDTSEGMVWRRK